MKKLLFLAIILLGNTSGFATCAKCEIIREENKKKVNPYEYYEDYLKDHPEGPQRKVVQPTQSPITVDNPTNSQPIPPKVK